MVWCGVVWCSVMGVVWFDVDLRNLLIFWTLDLPKIRTPQILDISQTLNSKILTSQNFWPPQNLKISEMLTSPKFVHPRNFYLSKIWASMKYRLPWHFSLPKILTSLKFCCCLIYEGDCLNYATAAGFLKDYMLLLLKLLILLILVLLLMMLMLSAHHITRWDTLARSCWSRRPRRPWRCPGRTVANSVNTNLRHRST